MVLWTLDFTIRR